MSDESDFPEFVWRGSGPLYVHVSGGSDTEPSPDPVVSEEMVEAGAKAIWRADLEHNPLPDEWERMTAHYPIRAASYREVALACLTAALKVRTGK